MPFYPYPYILPQYPHHVLPQFSVHSPFPPYPMPCYASYQEPRSTVDQRPDHDVNGINGYSDLNGQRGRESAEKHLDDSASKSFSSPESESQGRHHSDEDEQEMCQKEEVDDDDDDDDDDVKWWLPQSLLPRSNPDGDYMHDSAVLVKETTPPSIGMKKQNSRCDLKDDLSLMMLPRIREGETESYDPVKDDGEVMIKSSLAGNRRLKKVKEENKKLSSISREKVNTSKLSSLAEAQARATELRAFKAELLRTKRQKVLSLSLSLSLLIYI